MPSIDDVYEKVKDVPTHLPGIPGTLGGVATEVGKVLTGVGGIDTFLTGGVAGGLIDKIKKALEEFFTTCGNILEKPIEELIKAPGFEALLIKIMEALTKVAVKVTEAVAAVLKTLEAGEIPNKLSAAIEKLLSVVQEALLKNFKNLAALPQAIREGPLRALRTMQELGKFLKVLNRLQEIKNRMEVVSHSLGQLFDRIGGPGHGTIIQYAIREVMKLFTELIDTSDPPEKVLEKFILKIVFPVDALKDVLTAAFNGKLWFWADLPTGFEPGQLNVWLNDKTTYYSQAPALLKLERQFRTRLIVVTDAYLRRKIDSPEFPSPITRSDERLSAGLLADVICIFLDTVIHFVLEPDCFPLEDIELDGFEDLGVKFGKLYAQQIRISIRTTVGLLLRGFWEFSVHNEVLIELIGISISATFSAIIEAVIRNLTWSLQIVSRYQADPLASDAVLVHHWLSLEHVEGTNNPLEYVAVVRALGGIETPALGDPLKRLIEDFGAYLDASYQQFRIGSRFPDVAFDTITISRADIDGNKLTVWATTSGKYERPRPVLRAYFCCHSAVMRPGEAREDYYELELDLREIPRHCFDVTVLSNHGGRTSRRVVRV